MGHKRLNHAFLLAALLALTAAASVRAAGPAAPTTAPAAAEDVAPGEPGTDYAEGELIVRFRGGGERLLELPAGVPVADAARALAANEGIAYAVPNYIARAAAGGYVPNDPGLGKTPGGWQAAQWGFLPCGTACLPADASGQPPVPLPNESRGGIDTPSAWQTLRARGRPGGEGAKIAVLDTGIAFRAMRPKYAKSPDFSPAQFLPGYDFVSKDKLALDEDGHGTHVAGTIAEQTGNGKALTGIAYGAKVIPVRVLDEFGEGHARPIGLGIRYAVRHGADVINLSFEFGDLVQNCRPIKSVCTAINFAQRHSVLVVGAAGNLGDTLVAFPARIPAVVGVGASTEGACAANYSSYGPGLDLLAPGGRGEGGTKCISQDRPVLQLTIAGPGLTGFGYPTDYMGTSMSAAHVSGVAALIIASGVLGPHPSPARLECQLLATARKESLGEPYLPGTWGAGLLDAGRAVAAPAC